MSHTATTLAAPSTSKAPQTTTSALSKVQRQRFVIGQREPVSDDSSATALRSERVTAEQAGSTAAQLADEATLVRRLITTRQSREKAVADELADQGKSVRALLCRALVATKP